MRKECERRSLYKVRIVDRVNDLGAMAWAVAPELFCEGWYYWLRNNRKKLRKFVEKEHVLWYLRNGGVYAFCCGGTEVWI